MPNDEGSPNGRGPIRHSGFGLPSSLGIRHSSFAYFRPDHGDEGMIMPRLIPLALAAALLLAPPGPIRGSLIIVPDGNIVLTTLEPSRVTQPDRFELLKEIAATAPPGQILIDATLEMLQQAGAKKVKPDEARAWAEKVAK